MIKISLIKSWLDISNLLSTREKPCCDSNRALLFSDCQMPAFVRDGNNKARGLAKRGLAFSPDASVGISASLRFVMHPQNGS